MSRTVYVIVLEDFGQDTPKLYYNSEYDSWAKDPKYATKFANGNYANILKDVINFRLYCWVEEMIVE